jgi:hypothetical protein
MIFKTLISKISLVLMAFVLAGCGTSLSPIVIGTATPVPPTNTPTFTPSPVPTNTPTVTPTPMGGASGLLLSANGSILLATTTSTPREYFFRENLDLIFAYDMSQKRISLIDGYYCIGVSPDGKKIAMRKTENDKTDLFVMDLSKPEEIIPLYENVVTINLVSDYSYWLPGTEWIGFIAKKDWIPQIFVIHPDGSNLTQVTHSTIGAVSLYPVFNDGIIWDEGTESKWGGNIQNTKWTKLDGTEKILSKGMVSAVFPSGKYLVEPVPPYAPWVATDCHGCTINIVDPATDEVKEITLTRPRPDTNYPSVQPLSDTKWLVRWHNNLDKNGSSSTFEYWFYSSEGKPLFAFADLPHEHAPLPEGADNWDFYDLILKNSTTLPIMPLSPDGNLLLISHYMKSIDKKSNSGFSETSYYVLNLSTFEIQQVPDLLFDHKSYLGINKSFYWIDMP